MEGGVRIIIRKGARVALVGKEKQSRDEECIFLQ